MRMTMRTRRMRTRKGWAPRALLAWALQACSLARPSQPRPSVETVFHGYWVAWSGLDPYQPTLEGLPM